MAAVLKLPTLPEVAEVLARIHDAGAHIRVEKGRVVAGPKDALTDEIKTLIRSNRDAIVAVVPEEPEIFYADGLGYTLADLQEMGSLIRQLAEIEQWTEEEKAEALDGSHRMAPVRVPEVLQQLRQWVRAGLAGWPEKPAKRSRIVFCRLTVIKGGKA